MKYIPVFLLIVCASVSCKKTSKTTVTPILDSPAFSVFPGGMGTNDLSAIFTKDNNVVIIGNTAAGNVLLLKVTQTGTQLWRKEITLPLYYGFEPKDISSIVQTADNGFLLCGSVGVNGTYMGNPAYSSDIYVIKTNVNGDTLWSKRYGGPNEDYGGRIIATKDGNYLICGSTYGLYGSPNSYDDVCLLKINQNGDTLWMRSYPETEQQTAFHVLETKNGEYLVSGTNEPTGDGRIIYLLKTSASGDKLWENNIGPVSTSLWKWAYCSAEATNGDLYVCGSYKSHLLVVRTDASGNELWEKTYGITDSILQMTAVSIKRNADNSFTVLGNSYDYRDQSSKCVLLKVDENGNQLFCKIIPGAMSYQGANVLKCSNGDNIITGENYTDTTIQDIFFTRMDVNGNYK